MGLADLFRPKHRHSDVRVRTEAVRALTSDDAAILEQIARTDRDIGIRRIAIEKIETPDVLAKLGDAETERSLRELILERAAELWVTHACSPEAEVANTALAGIIKLGDQRALVDVVVRAQTPAVRKRAFGELRDPRALAQLAKSDAPQELRAAAVARIDDGDVLRALAIDTTQKEVGLAAVEKIDDVDRLENVANKAKNKAVRQKARKIVGEIAEAERAKKPGLPDDVKRRKAEKAQLIRSLESLAETFDFGKHSEQVSAAEVAWSKLGGADEGDDRFTKAAERFWKRKDVYESQARTSDELRAVEREAQRERDRAAAERAKKAAEPVAPVAPPVESDEQRAAREAQRAEDDARRSAQRAEEDARRAAQTAEREARQKEDAERGAAMATSLEAMCVEMETLAATDAKDGRVIDRLLQQAAKAFDNIGKVPPADRDKLADRYRDARGKLLIRASELKEAEDWLRWSNVPKAEALIETAKLMAEAPATPDLGDRLRQLQALWKEVGPMPQRRSKELWDTFKVECDRVFEKVKGVRAVENEKFADVAKAKEALITEAESLATSEDFAATSARLKELQNQWKLSGHLPRKQGDELWKRFRAACDAFFERRKPMLDAARAEEGANLARKQALITRAQQIANAAGEGTWGKAIGEIKDLQAEWKEIGYVPRRDADAVWRAFRTACDSLFTKRDQARDSEANAHRAQIDALKAEIEGVIAGGDDVVTRAIAVRTKAGELGVLGSEVVAMVQHVIAAHADAVKGTELDPAQLRGKRDKLIARAEELLPKQAAPATGVADIAAQLKQAMQKNAFGDLRFSGRDPVEVIEELRASWSEIGPILDEQDRAQVERFEDVVKRVLDAAGVKAREEREERIDGEGGRRRRGERQAQQPIGSTDPSTPMARPGRSPAARSSEPSGIAEVVATHSAMPESSPVTKVPDAAGNAVSAIDSDPVVSEEITVSASVPVATHDSVTQPARLPPEMPIGIPAVVSTPLPDPPRAKAASTAPPMDEIDGGWDMGDDDPTASAGDDKAEKETDSTPSSTEMAGDGSVEGDGLDQVD
ncbi:MAG: putative CheA signal transduction histidine kinase [Myxococcales bacterium]|nr:putative CheA signal transduction histidine kinase [Myxococcales bacterium]